MKKAANFLVNLVTGLLTAFAVGMMIFVIASVLLFNREDRNLMGYRFFVVLSDSMSKTDFSAGDLIVIKETDPSTLKEGDIISYISQDDANFGETVTHKIRKCVTDQNGNRGFITYGTTTDSDDRKIVTAMDILGKYQFSIPKAGTFFSFLKTTQGYITCILIPFLVLILYQIANCVRLFVKLRKEQEREVQAERKKTEAIEQELARLKAQLSEQTATKETDGQGKE